MRTRVQKLKKMNTTAPHYGRRIAFLRGLYKLTQAQLGDQAGFKQQEISEMEGKAELADEVLQRLLVPLGITMEKFKEMDESVMGSTIFHFSESAYGSGNFNTNNFNPIEKVIELVDKNEKLYERLFEAEKEKNAYLQRQLDNK